MATPPARRIRFRGLAIALLALIVLTLAVSTGALLSARRHLQDDPTGQSEVSRARAEINNVWRALALAQVLLVLPLAFIITRMIRDVRREYARVIEAEHRLAENEELFRLISENVSDWITVLDPQGRRLYSSSSVAKTAGAPASVILKPWLAEVHHEDRKAVAEALQRTAESGRSPRIQHRFQIANGPHRWMESIASAARDASGAVAKIVIVSRDITARENDLLRLQTHNAALAAVAKSPRMMGELQDAYHFVTETAAQTLGTSRASVWFFTGNLRAIRCMDLFDAKTGRHSEGMDLTSATYPKYFAALAEGRTIAAHNARLDPRTSEFSRDYLVPLQITSMLDAPIRRGGRLVGVICHEHTGEQREWTPDEEAFAGSIADLLSLALEMHDHRRTEDALRDARDHMEARVTLRTQELAAANERLKELDRLKSEFLATMSHELRTPLNSILGFTGILRQRLAGPLTTEQDKQLGMVQSAARHLLGLINDLLDLSRIESGKMELHLETFPVSNLVQ